MAKRLYPYSLADVEKAATELLRAQNHQDANNNIDLDGLYVEKKDHTYSLLFGITSRCNFDCPICYYHASERQADQKTDLPLETLQIIMDNCGQLNNVSLALEGEPFCYPKLFEALDIISQNADYLSISSNGSLLDKNKIRQLKNYNFSIFSLSIESGSNEHYALARKGGNLNNFMKNASDLVDALENHVFFNAIIYNENLESLINLPEIAAKVGVNKISFMLLREHERTRKYNIHKPSNENLKKYLQLIIAKAEEKRVYLLFDQYFANEEIRSWLRTLTSPYVQIYLNDNKICSSPWLCTSILSDGKLFPCCGDFAPAEINSYTFDGIFNHIYLRLLRKLLDQKIILPACKVCRNILGNANKGV